MTKDSDRLIAGRKIIKLGNVSKPQIAIYQPKDPNGMSVIICPGGGHYILAYDLEGTEVADWLNTRGITGIVLKYRVPFRDRDVRYQAAVQDAQRAMSLVRHRAKEWKLNPDQIGILGFSAGGETAALTSIFDQRLYQSVDEIDQVSYRPNFSMLIYPGGLADRESGKLREHVKVTDGTPPTFFVHAFDDHVTVQSSLRFASLLKEHDVPAELHIFASGGHGYGLRPTDEPVTRWPKLADQWLEQIAANQEE